ncbi:MAG: hypothetical protein VB021_00195 [Oscillospiraceae bacterium]|nr:hypothetical protein [Oscillospiraceae bacterium]
MIRKLLSLLGFILAFVAACFVADGAYRFCSDNCRKYIVIDKTRE